MARGRFSWITIKIRDYGVGCESDEATLVCEKFFGDPGKMLKIHRAPGLVFILPDSLWKLWKAA